MIDTQINVFVLIFALSSVVTAAPIANLTDLLTLSDGIPECGVRSSLYIVQQTIASRKITLTAKDPLLY